MRTVALPGTDLDPSRLAFGSAALMARLGRRESVRLLEAAYDSGITHFDTARAYGYGEAESAVGEFLSRRRDSVTVTTKLGIVPPRRSRGLQAAKSVARVAVSRAPAARGACSAARPVDGPEPGASNPREVRDQPGDQPARAGDRHVDILLLHECRPPDLETEGCSSFLEASCARARCATSASAPTPSRRA